MDSNCILVALFGLVFFFFLCNLYALSLCSWGISIPTDRRRIHVNNCVDRKDAETMKGNSQLEFVDSKRIPKSKGLGEETLFDFFY